MITTHSPQAIFWVLESMIPFGNHPLFLLLLGWMLPPKPAFMKLTTTPAVRAMTFTKQVFQDIVLPINKLEDQINKVSPLACNQSPQVIVLCRATICLTHTQCWSTRVGSMTMDLIRGNSGIF